MVSVRKQTHTKDTNRTGWIIYTMRTPSVSSRAQLDTDKMSPVLGELLWIANVCGLTIADEPRESSLHMSVYVKWVKFIMYSRCCSEGICVSTQCLNDEWWFIQQSARCASVWPGWIKCIFPLVLMGIANSALFFLTSHELISRDYYFSLQRQQHYLKTQFSYFLFSTIHVITSIFITHFALFKETFSQLLHFLISHAEHQQFENTECRMKNNVMLI